MAADQEEKHGRGGSMSAVIGDNCKRMCVCGAAFEGTKARSFEDRERHIEAALAAVE